MSGLQKHLSKNLKGLILTEALLAVALLAIGSMVLGSILNNAITTSAISRNYLIGENIATEGLEAVKNIRDSNWMILPNNSDLWLCPAPKLQCSAGATVGTNYISKSMAGGWSLFAVSSPALDIENSTAVEQKNYGLWLQNGQYTHTEVPGTAPSFYRSILFTNIDADESKATVNVKVQWWEGRTARTIERFITLYNYQ